MSSGDLAGHGLLLGDTDGVRQRADALRLQSAAQDPHLEPGAGQLLDLGAGVRPLVLGRGERRAEDAVRSEDDIADRIGSRGGPSGRAEAVLHAEDPRHQAVACFFLDLEIRVERESRGRPARASPRCSSGACCAPRL